MKRNLLILLIINILIAGSCAAKREIKEITAENEVILGIWEGTLDAGGTALRLVFNINRENGAIVSTMDSPDQGVTGIKVDSTILRDNVMTLYVDAINGAFTGTLKGNTAEGKWVQSGMEFEMVLNKTETAPVSALIRPQEPKEPLPYKTEEVKIKNEKTGLTLAGTLTIPDGEGPFPAVILVTGSGKQDRNETVFGHKPFLVIADWLTRNGVAVLRYDDRGAGESEGNFKECTTWDFADDAEAVFEYLYALDISDNQFTGIIGHSEGGMIAPIAAARNSDVGFIIMLAGPGVTLEEVVLRQSEDIGLADGGDKEKIEEGTEVNKKIYEIAKSDKSDSIAAEEITGILKEYRKTLSEEDKAELTDEAIAGGAKMILSKWFREGMRLDHTPYIKQVKCPVLAINGEKDLQVNADVNLPAIEKLLIEGGNPDYTIMKMPGINHALQECETGLPSEYGQIEQTVSPAVPDVIANWILEKSAY